jgi:hypothetical protein
MKDNAGRDPGTPRPHAHPAGEEPWPEETLFNAKSPRNAKAACRQAAFGIQKRSLNEKSRNRNENPAAYSRPVRENRLQRVD